MVTIQAIRNNDSNRVFFDAIAFFGDESYSIGTAENGKIILLRVNMKNGRTAHYRLKGSRVGTWYKVDTNL
jgi:hypothetical protein